MEAHTCNHPMVSHTVWYWLNNQRPEDGPVSRSFDNLEDADGFAQKIIRQNPKRLSWLKIFRSDNEVYTCFRWDNPKKERMPMAENETHVKLEVDMEPLKEAFDNVATGFKEQGQAIRKVQLVNIALAGLITANFIMDWVIR